MVELSTVPIKHAVNVESSGGADVGFQFSVLQRHMDILSERDHVSFGGHPPALPAATTTTTL